MDEWVEKNLSAIKLARNVLFVALVVIWVTHALIKIRYIDIGIKGWTRYPPLDLSVAGYDDRIVAVAFDDRAQLWGVTRSLLGRRNLEGEWIYPHLLFL